VSSVKVFAIGFGIAIFVVGTAPDVLAEKNPDSADRGADVAVTSDEKTDLRKLSDPGKISTEGGALSDGDQQDKDLAQVTKVIESSDKEISAGKLDKAVTLLISALKDFGESPQLRERLSRVYYLQGKVDEAISELEVAVSLDPTNFDYHAGVAWLYSIAGKYSESVKFAKQAIALDSTRAYPLVVMGFSLGCMGKRSQAAELLRKAIAIDPENATAYLYLADVLLADGDYKQALPLYQKSLKLDSRTSSAFVGLGDCFQKLGHHKEAIAAYTKAVDLAPQDATARGHLGFALSQSGDVMGSMRQGFAANSIRIGQYWGKFMGMFVAVWAGIFIFFGTIFGAMFMSSRFQPLAGEQVQNEFLLVFYRDRPGRFVITDRRLVFIPELVSRWFGATRVSMQREQILASRMDKARDVTLLVLTTTSGADLSFRIPAPIAEPLRNVLSEQGLFGEGLQSLEATGANRALVIDGVGDAAPGTGRVGSSSGDAKANTLKSQEVSQEVSQELSNSFIAASFDFRTPEAAEETDNASTLKLSAIEPGGAAEEKSITLERPKSFERQGGPRVPQPQEGKNAASKAKPKKSQPGKSADTDVLKGQASSAKPAHNRRAEDKPAHNRRAEDKKDDDSQ